MTKFSISPKSLAEQPKKYTRVILTENSVTKLTEKKNGEAVIHLATPKFKSITPERFHILVREIVVSIKKYKLGYTAFELQKDNFPKLKDQSEEWFYRTIAENLLLADYEFTKYKTKKKESGVKEIMLAGCAGQHKSAWQTGLIVATATNEARDIANTPGDDLTPSALDREAQKLAKGTNIKVTVFDEKQIKKEGLHALWAVGKGADDMPRFIVMEYWGKSAKPAASRPTKPSDKPIVLVGKGITYDTGGLNIKPSGAMHEMHMDMSGGAAVIASTVAAAKLKLKKNIITIVPVAENSVSAKSMRAGDIINSHSGKTIEVLHTDAEGRLVLADGLSYAKKYDPRVVLDVATLTGASLVALGQHASAIMTKNQKLQDFLVELGKGKESGDRVWPLPLWDEYKTPLTKTRADVVNIHPNFSKFGGTIEGAAFLSFFAPKCPWAHLDVAPRMTSIPSDKLASGATGEPVRLLVRFLESY